MNIKYDDLTKLFAIEQAKETSYTSQYRFFKNEKLICRNKKS